MHQFQEVLAFRDSKTFAIFQCEFGAQTPKPTRFVTDLMGFEGPIHSGIPQFNKNWKYQGPLPAQCPHPGSHDQLIKVRMHKEIGKQAQLLIIQGPCAF